MCVGGCRFFSFPAGGRGHGREWGGDRSGSPAAAQGLAPLPLPEELDGLRRDGLLLPSLNSFIPASAPPVNWSEERGIFSFSSLPKTLMVADLGDLVAR